MNPLMPVHSDNPVLSSADYKYSCHWAISTLNLQVGIGVKGLGSDLKVIRRRILTLVEVRFN